MTGIKILISCSWLIINNTLNMLDFFSIIKQSSLYQDFKRTDKVNTMLL